MQQDCLCCQVVNKLSCIFSIASKSCCAASKEGERSWEQMMVVIYSTLYVTWLSATLGGLQLLKRLETNDRNSLRRGQEGGEKQ